MKSYIRLFFSFVLFALMANISYGQIKIANNNILVKANYVSLNGQIRSKGNPVTAEGNIHQFKSPVLHLFRTKSATPQGTVLLFPGGGYEYLKNKNEGEITAQFLNAENFDVAILEYHVASNENTRDLALVDAVQAFRLLQSKRKAFGLRGDRLNMMGISSGGHLAARTVQKLEKKEQPDDLILISPCYLDETTVGTVFPAIMPPVQPKARLFTTFSANDKKSWIKSSQEYTKIWKGYDGQSIFHLLADSTYVCDNDTDPLDNKMTLPELLKAFLKSKPDTIVNVGPNPAAIPVEGYAKKRHEEKLKLIAKEKFDLVFIGNSITNNFENAKYRPIWKQFYEPRKALNLGTSAYRTENLIWDIQNGALEGQSPKVVVLEIGTNNVDEKNYPTRHTAGQLAGGIEAIVALLREKLPETKIIVLRCFPGCYGGPNPTSHRAILERASDVVSKLADGKHIFYCDVNHVFLNMDGSINHDMMGDWLHPTPAGAKAWAQAMEPLLSELMGDKSLDTDIPANTAIVPVPKIENDIYDWWGRHQEVLNIKDSINPEIVLIGNSITHFWGGEPKLRDTEGNAKTPNGPKTWAALFGNHKVLNLGFGWDRTQNVLWRLDHGELDRLHPKTVIIGIGTNNTCQTDNARMNTAPEIIEGIRAICMRVRSKVPGAKIVLMAILPREQSPTNPRRILINEINLQLESFAKKQNITFVNIESKMLDSDGTLPKEIASDFCHPTEKGYQIWADAIRPFITEP